MIKAITFDLDDTLWDVWPVVERAEQLLHDWLAENERQFAAHFGPDEPEFTWESVDKADVLRDAAGIK